MRVVLQLQQLTVVAAAAVAVSVQLMSKQQWLLLVVQQLRPAQNLQLQLR